MGKSVTLTSASQSAALDLGPLRLAAITPPATLAANTARLTFQGSLDGTNYDDIEDKDSTLYTVTVSTTNATTHYLEAEVFKAYRWLKFTTTQSDGSTAVSQVAATFDLGLLKYTG